MTTIEKFVDLCYIISNDDNSEFSLWWDYLKIYENDNDYPILKEKITNFLKLLNENTTFWFDKEIETEIYPQV